MRQFGRAVVVSGACLVCAWAAKAAGVPFLAILSKKEPDYRQRAKKFCELGALGLLEQARDLKDWLE